MNARGGDGAEVIYALRSNDTLPSLILDNLKNEGQNIRKAYQRRLPSNPNKDYYFMLRNTGNTEALIIEYGFLDSTKDDITQLKSNWQDYAEAVVKAIADYTGLKYNNLLNNNYTVLKGDTLWSIAKKFGINVEELKRINNLNNNVLSIGQLLNIPLTNQGLYTVKAGDTLYKIAQKNNSSIEELMRLNNLKSNLLSIGQQLILPPSQSLDQTYTVQKGDTLYTIANKFGTTVENIMKNNNLMNTILSINQILKI